jgi:hypothetical protein
MNGTCQECSGNFYGNYCNISCANCIDGCDINDGKCNFTEYCKDFGYFGEYCLQECKEINENCSTCFINGTCQTCLSNNYGNYCNSSCGHCVDGCNIEDGKCNNKEYCEDFGYFGEYCLQECKDINENCSTCFLNGTCQTCLGNNYGNYCNISCPNCIDGCSIEDGKCNNNEYCKDFGYYGEYCDNECYNINENCTTCFLNGTCQTCLGNNYGNYCNISCPNCIDGCEINDGKCNFIEYCKDFGYFGEYCKQECKEINESCSTCFMNGTCQEC